jgi:alpha-L-rhamnosidase-like protein
VRRLLPLAAVVLLQAAAPVPAPAGGSFQSSDGLLNAIWQESAKTAGLMLSPPVRLGPGCRFPAGRTIILDGVVRDRCEFIGDLAVTGHTLLVSRPGIAGDLRFALQSFAGLQRADGSLPPLTAPADASTLADYQAYWIDLMRTYLLYTGDLGAARSTYACLTGILDRYYPAHERGGLYVDGEQRRDYAGIARHSARVLYYNALYVLALDEGAQIARWLGRNAAAHGWLSRAATLRRKVAATFWDPAVGAFKDTPDAPVVHPQDGNAFAVLSGVASSERGKQALDYLAHANSRSYGNTIADTNLWADDKLWGSLATERVYPFMSYFEVLARFKTGLDNSALDLIRREWGYMLHVGPGTTWETIGPYGSGPVNHSWAHGWSSGAAPALTEYVLGVRPTSPGFRTFVVDPKAGSVIWAAGSVPTPRGPIRVSWKRMFFNRYAISVQAPAGERYQSTSVSGKSASPAKRSSR